MSFLVPKEFKDAAVAVKTAAEKVGAAADEYREVGRRMNRILATVEGGVNAVATAVTQPDDPHADR